MAFVIIPTTTDVNQLIPVTLDAVGYELQLLWNGRSKAWFLSIYNSAGDLLLGGIKAVVNYPLLRIHPDLELPAGELYFWDQSGAGTDPGRDEMGTRVILVYKEA